MVKGVSLVVLVVVLAVALSSSAIVHEDTVEGRRDGVLLRRNPPTSTFTTGGRPGPLGGAQPFPQPGGLAVGTPAFIPARPLPALVPPRSESPTPTPTTTTGVPTRDFNRPGHSEAPTRDLCLPADPNGRADAQGINDFGLDVFRYLAKDGNVFISPFNLWSALSLAYLGAERETAAQMGRMLRIQGKQNTHQYFNRLENELSSRFEGHKNLSLEAASKVYINKGFQINECLQSYLTKHLQTIDFTQIVEAADIINSYVNKTTRGLIDSIVQPDMLTNTQMAIVSAIYFFGTWEKAFEPSSTHEMAFYPEPNRPHPQNVKMMFMEATLQLGKSDELGAEVLRLPYTTGNVAMYVLLPTTEGKRGFEGTLRALNSQSLQRAFGGLRETLVQVGLPKFKMEVKYDQEMKEALKRLGATHMFDTRAADFSAFSPDLYMSAVIHKAFVDVNEAGTEAAAITGVLLNLRSARREPERFICDRPFIFAIHDDVEDVMLFLGAYTTPTRA